MNTLQEIAYVQVARDMYLSVCFQLQRKLEMEAEAKLKAENLMREQSKKLEHELTYRAQMTSSSMQNNEKVASLERTVSTALQQGILEGVGGC